MSTFSKVKNLNIYNFFFILYAASYPIKLLTKIALPHLIISGCKTNKIIPIKTNEILMDIANHTINKTHKNPVIMITIG